MRAARALALVMLLALAAPPVSAAEAPTPFADRVRNHVDRAVDGGLGPVDFHHLLLAFQWRSGLADWKAVGAALDRLAAAGGDPLMQDEVRRWRARVAVEEGKPAAARALLNAAGGLERWWVNGPVAIEELEDFPARAIVPAADAAWRAAPGTDPLGWVRLSGLAWPAQRQLLYLATTVESVGEQPVAIRVGAAQAARVWLNGVEVLTTPRPLAHAEDQACAGGWLRPGSNLVVVAVASESDDWWLRARLTAPDGSALAGVREVDRPPQPQPALERPAPAVRSLESEIRAAVQAGAPEASLALAAFLVVCRPQPVGDGSARAACAAARREAPAEARLLEWLVGGDPAAAQALLEGAVDADPGLLPARIALARWTFSRGLFEAADSWLRPADAEPAARAARLDLEAELWGPVALPALAALTDRAPNCVDGLLVLANQALEAKRWDLGRTALERLRGLVPGLSAVTELDERLAAACGDGEALRASLERRLELDRNQPELRVRLSRLLVAAGSDAEARATLDEGLGRCPDHPDLLLELARLEHAAGRDVRAVELAHRLVELRPQERRAQRLLERLGVATEEDTWRRPPEELWALAEGAPRGGPAVVLLDHREVRFLPGNLSEERAQQAILITAGAQADAFREHTLPHVPERQRLRVLSARILHRDGSETSARQADTPRLSDPEVNVYYDTRLRVLRFPALADGDLIELSWVLSETAEANETGPYKGGLIRLAHEVPTVRTEVELSGPADRLPAWELVHLEAAPERSQDADGTVHLRWRLRDVPALPHDVPPAPSLAVTPHLVYSSHPGWGQLAGWYARHVAPRVLPSRQVEETARRLVAGLDDRRARIVAICRYVTDQITYVGLELGEHRFRPFSADWVLKHRVGDCKDKAALLVALYESVGIPARMALLRVAEQGPVEARLAVLEDFNHAIVYLPEDDLWLDGTATGHDPSQPPAMDQGAAALVIDGPTSQLVTTPVVGAGVSRTNTRLRPGAAGSVELELRTEDTGEAADVRRSDLGGSADPRRFARWLQSRFPGAELTGEPLASLQPGRDPVTIQLVATVGRSALLAGGGIPTFPERLDLVARLAPVEGRTSPLLVAVRPDLEWTLEVELGRPPPPLPEPVTLDTRYGSLQLAIEDRTTGYRVEGKLHLKPGLLTPAQAAGLREFLVGVERQLGRPLEVP